jgi:hypothetical protein
MELVTLVMALVVSIGIGLVGARLLLEAIFALMSRGVTRMG